MKLVLLGVYLLAFVIPEIFSSTNRYSKNFLCANGLYVRNDHVCDGVDNCGDFSDEFHPCNMGVCSPGMFACNDSRCNCLPMSKRCNTIKECDDGSDELNCGNDTVLNDCSINRNKFLCEDELKCIDLSYTCDGECNCFDCSDESASCSEQSENLCNTCSLPCLPTPDGPQCACSSLTDREWTPLCQEVLHCSKDTKCEQKCVRFSNKERCLCDENYQTSRNENNTIICRNSVSHENVLLYSTTNQVKILNLTSNIVAVVEKDIHCMALTAAHNYAYCGVRRNNTAYVSKISQNNEEIIDIIKSDSRVIYSIGVDWITGNVYFTTNSSLSVCDNEGSICTKLKSLSMGDSYHLGLAPRFGLIFWTVSSRHEHEESQIFRSAMDGSNERVLINEEVRYPTSFVVDELSERVYWLELDLQFAIRSVQFNGKNIKEWILGLWLPSSAFSFSVFEKKTFISTRSDKIHEAEYFLDSAKLIADKSGASVKYLYAYNALLQRTKISNPCKGSCQGLCLLRPSSVAGLNYTCLCEHVKSNNTIWCRNTTIVLKESDDSPTFEPINLVYLCLVLLPVFLAGYVFHCLIQKCSKFINCKKGGQPQMNVAYNGSRPRSYWL